MVMVPGELAVIRADSLRLMGRIARLQAEMDGSKEIHFPPELTTDPDSALSAEVVALERTVFAARAAETDRQLTTLAELSEMYDREIQNLAEKGKTSEEELELAKTELDGVEELVDQGIMTVARRSELRRLMAQTKARRLDEDVQMLRAQQGLSETARREFGVRDQRRTAVAADLQAARADLARLRTREEALRQLLLSGNVGPAAQPSNGLDLRFFIVRQHQSGPKELPATQSTPLLPGDVLRVEAVREVNSDGNRADDVGSAVAPSNPRADNVAAAAPVTESPRTGH
jgi:polysaccharide export outer membrane protein